MNINQTSVTLLASLLLSSACVAGEEDLIDDDEQLLNNNDAIRGMDITNIRTTCISSAAGPPGTVTVLAGRRGATKACKIYASVRVPRGVQVGSVLVDIRGKVTSSAAVTYSLAVDNKTVVSGAPKKTGAFLVRGIAKLTTQANRWCASTSDLSVPIVAEVALPEQANGSWDSLDLKFTNVRYCAQ